MALILMNLNTSCSEDKKSDSKPSPPMAEKIAKELTVHEHKRIDNYYWLNERDNPAVIDYLKAENAYTDAMMKHTETLQEQLYNEIIGRTDVLVWPVIHGSCTILIDHSQREAGRNLPVSEGP